MAVLAAWDALRDAAKAAEDGDQLTGEQVSEIKAAELTLARIVAEVCK